MNEPPSSRGGQAMSAPIRPPWAIAPTSPADLVVVRYRARSVTLRARSLGLKVSLLTLGQQGAFLTSLP